MKYPEYLKTAHFLNVKKRALKFWDNKCSLCSNPNDLHIHHNSYNWFEEKDSDVVVLCKNCHEKFHNIGIDIMEVGVPPPQKNDELTVIPNKFEKTLIKLLFEGDRDIIEFICDNYPPKEFSDETLRKLATLVCESTANDAFSPSAIIEQIADENVKKLVMSLAIDNDAISKKWNDYSHTGKIEIDMLQYTQDIIKNYKLNQIDTMIKANNRRAEESDDEEEILKLFKDNDELITEKEKIIGSING